MHCLEQWPRLLQELAALIGLDATLALAEKFGGQDHCYVPKRVREGHPWAAVIGVPAFEKITNAYGGEKLNLPRGAFVRLKKVRIVELAEQGALSHRAIASECRCSERYVRAVLSGFGS